MLLSYEINSLKENITLNHLKNTHTKSVGFLGKPFPFFCLMTVWMPFYRRDMSKIHAFGGVGV